MARILVVEDSPTQAERLRLILEDAGMDAEVAADAEVALARLAASSFDMVITDIVMPRMSGYDLCRTIKADPAGKSIPVILLTTRKDPMDIFRGLECGADNFYTKPYDPERLIERIRNILYNRNLRSQGKLKVGIEVAFFGKTFLVGSEKEQILDLLISTFEDIVQTNLDLEKSTSELTAAKAKIEEYARLLEGRVRGAEKKYSAKESNYEAVVASSIDAIITSDDAGRIVGWNRSAERLFGYAEAEIIGQPVTALMLPRFHERHLSGMERAQSAGERLNLGKTIEGVGRRKDTSEFPLELSPAAWRSGESQYFTATIRDITERKAREATIERHVNLYAALSKCNKAIAHCTTQEELLQQICTIAVRYGGIRAAWVRLVDNETHVARLVAKSGDFTVRAKDKPISTDTLGLPKQGPTVTAIRENRPVWVQEIRQDPANAPWQEHAVHSGIGALASLPIHCKGIVVGAFALGSSEANSFDEQARDLLTEMAADIGFALDNFDREARRRHMEEDLRAAGEKYRSIEQQLHQTQKLEAVGQLAGGIAHDFNNLLTVIIGNLELLEAAIPEEGLLRKRVQAVRRAADRGADLTRRLLAFSRRQTLESKTCNVTKLIAGTDEMLRRTLGDAIEINTAIPSGIWLTQIDESQFENALLNLAINARDAMPNGGKLTIESANVQLDENYAACHAELRPGEYVMVAVSDTGVGMPPHIVERVFEPFFTTKGRDKGTGLGLSMVYGFIKQSGGHANIYSEVGHGTTVRMYLPRLAVDVPAGRDELKADSEPFAQSSITVLIVDDNADVRELGVAMLEYLGCHVIEAENGRQALELLQGNRAIDVLFTDVLMPGGMSGTALAEEALKVVSGLKVLYCTGYADAAVINGKSGGLGEGAVFLSKPYTRAELARKLDQILKAQG